MTIKLLSENVASRIAAGEVVERPASVVKELVENSLDAGATRVDVETSKGGTALIRVRDNGSGILSREVELAFKRHATSKLERATDLEHISTLGFRGEALSSVASVSRMTCITHHASEATGTQLRLEGGTVVHRSATGRPPGTELIVEDLFYNVPARRKFLKAERTERRHIDAFMTRYAIAYPNTAFTVVHDGRRTVNTPGSGDAREVLLSVYGPDLGGSLLEIPADLTLDLEVQVCGFVGPTTVHRANRGYMTLFINGRWIEDLRLSYAIIQAYHTLLPVKRYPIAFVMVEMPPEDVDVNVHPTKAEVRFRDGDSVFRAIQRTVRATVVAQAPATATWTPPTQVDSPTTTTDPLTPAATTNSSAQQNRARLAALRPSQSHIQFPPIRSEPTNVGGPVTDSTTSAGVAPPSAGPDWTLSGPGTVPSPSNAIPVQPGREQSRQQLPPLRIVGQVATMFIVAEGPEGLYLIDQHAAHERVLYEQMLSNVTTGQVPSQPLLEPQVVSLPADEADRLEEMLPALHQLGLEAEVFGTNTFLVRAVPAQLRHIAPADLLADVAAAAGESSPIRAELEEIVIRHICKRAAVKAGQVLSTEEMTRLIHDLEATENPRTCPHGRPTIVQISTETLARQFGRGGAA
jgi:DNA mismatch repair protein MutL